MTVTVQHRPHLRRSILEPSVRAWGAAASNVVVLGCKAGNRHFQAPLSGTGCAEATVARLESCSALTRRGGWVLGGEGMQAFYPPRTAAELSAFS